MKFEDLLPKGKKLHDLTDEEIDAICQQCSVEDLEKIEVTLRKDSRKTKSKKSLAAEKKKLDEFNKLLLGIKP